ncbi:MAG: PQQ-dependent sugar dehydrogenase [Acidimicrobiales bacterium]
MLRGLALVVGAALLLGACSDDEADPGPPTITASPSDSTTPSEEPGTTAASPSDKPGPPRVVDTIATGLAVPWGIGFLPDGTAVVTERDSRRVLTIDARGRVNQIGSVPEAQPGSEGGLLGVAVPPDWQPGGFLYFYASTASDNRILRAPFDRGRLGASEVVLDGIPVGQIHDGGRLAFGPDGNLYASTGETGLGELAHDRGSLGGKILRITPDGDPAPGNPDPDSPIWTWGHRNVQGLAFDGNRLWASEFGQDTFDELNLIQKGDNYGWPIFEGRGDDRAYTNPQVVWNTDEASPSGLAYLDGHLWLAALQGERLWRIDVKGDRASNPTDFFVGKYGRLRTVVVAPDGNLWVTTSNRAGRGARAADDDRILVIDPS